MSVLVQNATCVCCGKIYIIEIKLTEVRKNLNVECPYCHKAGEIKGTEIISIRRC